MKILERQLLVLPVVATLFVALAFVCGLPCSAWQWWSAVAVVYVAGLWRSECRKRDWWKFPVLLVGYWFGCQLFRGGTSNDALSYHLPAIKMMILGWNPIYQGTLDAIHQTMSLAPGSFHGLHVVAMQKSVWYYSACAYFFHGNVFNLMLPVFLPVCLAVFLQIWHSAGKVHWAIKTSLLVIVLWLVPSIGVAVDAIVAVSAVGLVCALSDAVRKNEFRWLHLFAFSFWMVTPKQTAALHCFIIWTIFALAILIQSKMAKFRALASLATVLILTFALANVAPYVTNWVNYGHPLYPKFTSDPVKHPVVDITCDFLDRNDDAASMGKVQAFLNSYVSHDLVRLYNQKVLGKKDWRPKAYLWHFGGVSSEGYDSPTRPRYRACFVALMFLVLVCGGLAGRLTVLAVLCSIFVMPTEMIGYLRYVPWIFPAWIVLLAPNVERLNFRIVRCDLTLVVLMAYFLPSFVNLLIFGAVGIDNALAIRLWLKSECGKQIVVGNFYKSSDQTVSGKGFHANCILTQRICPDLARRELYFDKSRGKYPTSMRFYDLSFFVPSGEGLEKCSDHYRNRNLPDPHDRLLHYPSFIARAYTVTVARIVFHCFS